MAFAFSKLRELLRIGVLQYATSPVSQEPNCVCAWPYQFVVIL